ncbi:MAG: hypothetical protein PHH75_01085 [Candidatus Omnitrophica bacterium]|nr:hypothetical protein [Candidatus Omnitrophota bacterium]MDD5573751.1 hypothetical protein [Candidatus Omnitrophota bacterium]
MCKDIYIFPALYVFSALSFLVGFFIYLKPRKAISIQVAFYRKINWRMEPVSMEKEVRNTKVMGLFLLVVATASLITILLKDYALSQV